MNKYLLITLLTIASLDMSAQFKNSPTAKESQRQAGEKILNTNISKDHDTSVTSQKIDFSAYVGNTFQPTSSDNLRLIKKDNTAQKWVIAKDQSKRLPTDKWLTEAAGLLNLDLDKNNFVEQAQWSDDIGQTHTKYNQYHNGIKVFGAEVIIHADQNGAFMQNGEVIPSSELPELNRKETITEIEAKTLIQSEFSNFQDWATIQAQGIGKGINQWEGSLVYYKLVDEYQLAYHYRVFPNPIENMEYIIDAQTGKIITKWSNICKFHHGVKGCQHDHEHHNHTDQKEKATSKSKFCPVVAGPEVATNVQDLLGQSRTINTYSLSNNFFLLDASRSMFNTSQSSLPEDPVGVIWTLDVNNQSPVNGNITYSQVLSSNNRWTSSPEGVSAHYNAGQAYDYFKTVHGREAITGDGQNIVSIVNVSDEDGSSLGNAFYSSLALWYGNGDNTFFPLGRALDVAGHELSHGVVEFSANLVYQDESGAMNESFADIFGAMIDRSNWTIGEQAVRPGVFPGGALRNMQDPHNNANTGDFGRGWQPKHMNERFTGSEDNGGVHLNSGIPNHAFYLLATQTSKEVAEQIYYRALTTYLTRRSGFNDLRYAVVQAAQDLYGANTVSAAESSFDQVGITDGSVPDHETEIIVNEGADLLLVSDASRSNLTIFDLVSGTALFDPLSRTPQLSKPSVTDDGSRIVFVGTDNQIHLIDIDWTSNPPRSDERIVSNSPDWRNAIITKQGDKIALLETTLNDEVIVIDIVSNTENTFDLFNPTYTEGVQTGDVLFADAMEFDHTGETLMYDAQNEIKSTLGTESIRFWDIGFLEVWNASADTWALGNIDKLFGTLPEDVSIGNPTFSKNSPHIIAFDVLQGQDISIFGMNIETNDRDVITENTSVGYPNFSRSDDFVVYDFNDSSGDDLAIINLENTKITGVASTRDILGPFQWGVWFSNGSRILTNSEEVIQQAYALELSPNPAYDQLTVELSGEINETTFNMEITNIQGQVLKSATVDKTQLIQYKIDIEDLDTGTYILTLRSGESVTSKKFVKL